MLRISFIVAICTVLAVQAKFPDDPKPCKYGNSECILKILNTLITEKSTLGDRELNLVKLDPLAVARINIKQGADSPVNIDLTFLDNNVNGLSSLKFSKVKGFGKTIAATHELHYTVDKMSLVGPYNIKGKVLILPISGSGESNMTMVDSDMHISFVGKPVEKDGETYMEATNLKLVTKPKRLYYYFGNLFNGDKVLGDNMNVFLNDNWEPVFLEVQKSIESAFGKVFEAIITNVFSKYPYAKFFEDG